MTWKITPSLYNAWLFYAKPQFDRTDEQETQARADFIRVLKKEPTEPTDTINRGIQFENAIMSRAGYATDSNETDLLTEGDIVCAENIAQQVAGGVFQIKDGRELPSGNYIYGVADCILLNGIWDFKRATEYTMGKYQKSIQHWAYMYIWNLPIFYYAVGTGDTDAYMEPYTWFDGATGLLDSCIAEMIHWINSDAELREYFAEHWTYKKEQENGLGYDF